MRQLLTNLLLSCSLVLSSASMAHAAVDVRTGDSAQYQSFGESSANADSNPSIIESLSMFALSALLGSVAPDSAQLVSTHDSAAQVDSILVDSTLVDSIQVDSSGDTLTAAPAVKASTFDTILSAAIAAAGTTIEATLNEVPQILSSSEDDPFERYNRLMFRFNSQLDEKALRPLAEHYREYTPALVRAGVSNFFSNIGDIGVVANDALQGKVEQALLDSSRLTINTVAGLGGVLDVASMLNIKKNKEDFGQTFGVWGIPEGPYLVLPVLGPRTMRSAVGTAFDTYLQAEALGAVGEAAAGQELVTEMLALNLVNQREKALGKEDLIKKAAIDPYIFTREAYLAYRRCQVEDCDKIDYKPATPETSDQLDELDRLDELDQLDQLDELDLLDELE